MSSRDDLYMSEVSVYVPEEDRERRVLDRVEIEADFTTTSE